MPPNLNHWNFVRLYQQNFIDPIKLDGLLQWDAKKEKLPPIQLLPMTCYPDPKEVNGT
jgi:hypothetical protein